MAGVALASEAVAEQAARALLDDGGNAVDAVVAGFLAAGQAGAGALLSPLCALVAGVGAGAHLFDGRACQPGADAPRPRGFTAGEAIPATAYAAAPRSLKALALLHAYGATRPWRALAQPSRALCRSDARRDFVALWLSHGAGVYAHPDVQRALLRAAGPAAGGLITSADLDDARPVQARVAFAGGVALTGLEGEGPRPAAVIVAASPLGQVAALAYAPDEDGILVPELGVRLTRDAEPIRRGVPRVTPRTPRAMPAPLAVVRGADGMYAALAAPGSRSALPFEAAPALAETLEAFRAALGAREALGVGAQRRRTWQLRSPGALGTVGT